jgi:hypothetical protein
VQPPPATPLGPLGVVAGLAAVPAACCWAPLCTPAEQAARPCSLLLVLLAVLLLGVADSEAPLAASAC